MSSTTPVDIGTIPLSLVPKPSIGNAWNGYAWYYGPSSNAIVAHVIIYTDTGIVSVVTPNPSGTSATGLRFTLGYETN